MTMHNPNSGHNTGLPYRRQPKPILSPNEWAELHDMLTLALDALGDGPADVDLPFFFNCIMHQRGALKLAHGVKERMEKAQ